VSHWTDIPTEAMATSTICNQSSVRICSLAVNMNNTDESFFFTVGVLNLLTFSLHKMLKMQTMCSRKFERERTKPYCSTCVAVADFLRSHRGVACRM
jgi:hypothetical protein